MLPIPVNSRLDDENINEDILIIIITKEECHICQAFKNKFMGHLEDHINSLNNKRENKIYSPAAKNDKSSK